jgi:hypothetical protein
MDEIKEEIKRFLEVKESENMTYKNLSYHSHECIY